MPVLELRDVTKVFPGVVANDRVSFSLEEGEILALLGENGAGKSTIMNVVYGLLSADGGEILIDGEPVRIKSPRHAIDLGIGMVHQHFMLVEPLTVTENIVLGREPGKFGVIDFDMARTRVLELSERYGLKVDPDAKIQDLAVGMQQRVGLARALATDADVRLMDEAFSALDPLIRSEMQQQLVGLQQDLQKTIVFITHDLNEAMFLGDRIAIMKEGRIIQIGTTEEILQEPADDYVRAFVQDVDRSRVLTAGAVMQEPVSTILRRKGPLAALREMRLHQMSGLFVVDEHKRLVGAATDDDVVRMIHSGESSLEHIIPMDEIEQVSPETPLVDCLIPSAESRLPLAVVDDGGALLGIIPRVTLLTALGGSSGTTEIKQPIREPSAVDGYSAGEGMV